MDHERWRQSLDRYGPEPQHDRSRLRVWLNALEAADSTQPAPIRRREWRRSEEATAANGARRRARNRQNILAAVRRCTGEIGRPPSATEFLRWRADRAPDSPCQMTIYRTFPGGFAEVLAAALSPDADELAA